MATKSRKTMKKPDVWHRKIAQNRGESWRKNMIKGRRDAILNPSLIRILRNRKDMHQSVIAKRVGLSESTYGAIERGKQPVKAEVAKKIAVQVGVAITKIFKPTTSKGKFVAVIQKSAI